MPTKDTHVQDPDQFSNPATRAEMQGAEGSDTPDNETRKKVTRASLYSLRKLDRKALRKRLREEREEALARKLNKDKPDDHAPHAHSIPEEFNILVREMRSLGLKIEADPPETEINLESDPADLAKSPSTGGNLARELFANRPKKTISALDWLRDHYPHEGNDFGDLTLDQVEADDPSLAKGLKVYAKNHRISIYSILPATPERRGAPRKDPGIDLTKLNPNDPIHALALMGAKRLEIDRDRKRAAYKPKTPHP